MLEQRHKDKRKEPVMKLQIIIGLIAALLLTQMPIVGKYFAVVNTMIHESGHSLIALITGGEVRQISLFPNTSGVTMTGHSSWISQFFTSIAGYVTSSLFAFLFFYLIMKGQYKWMIYILLGFLFINLIFWVRNFYGIFWIVTFGSAFIYLLRSGKEGLIQFVLVFIACLVLVESVTSAFEIMWISFIAPQQAGDAANLARATRFIPAPLFGAGFFAQSLYFAWMALKRVFG
ncbi:M50 family metallopeptidase [Halobacillus salinarum]|uniref:M50 family metallopeptidase n=1 Tax=Halobacillus salinarum TaxID=2932257 RepID=A0ABY4EJV2_9BACI|nr:M50 family metallopeptidase [Halobacillus salinarum]UOQ44715.1 M50 family metallopeptidase [Halobacillus salinarum]